MRASTRARFVGGMVAIVAVALAGTLKGRDDYMRALPAFKLYKCQLCHTGRTPAAANLNSFGKDFRSNGYAWDAALAVKDSDSDGYSNGYEIGDDNGDGTLEAALERSNPGDSFNIPSSISQQTWGIIKSLFEG